MNKVFNILVTGCGGDIGQSIGKILLKSKYTKNLFGIDISNKNAAQFIYPDFSVGVPFTYPDYLQRLELFIDKHDIGNIDFIKIDVQGAELDIFKGASNALKNVLNIVCEVEFIDVYENQPLFGDICNYLSQYNLMFNKFLGLAGRAIKPVKLDNNLNKPSQHMWSDAVFVHHILKIHDLNNIQLIKLSLLACVYYSLDLTFYCLSIYDKRNSTSFARDWMTKISDTK